VSVIAPIIVGGNTVVALASTSRPLNAVTFGEVLATSDLPGGVVNLLTGERSEILDTMANHMDVNAIVYAGAEAGDVTRLRELCSLNIKRPTVYDRKDWSAADAQSPYFILDTQEVKTAWHPIGT
jgi:acyl-CoA reductase-like NAD-dependent aldehyde dehydrogenase